MIGVTQTRTGFPSGNCTEAALASVLGCGLDDVPVLWCGRFDVATVEEAQPSDRMAAMLSWLRETHGKQWIEWRFVSPMSLPLTGDVYSEIPEWRGDWAEPHFLVGPNPDGIAHVVVGVRGAVAWDSNPLRRGIVAATRIGQLWPVAE